MDELDEKEELEELLNLEGHYVTEEEFSNAISSLSKNINDKINEVKKETDGAFELVKDAVENVDKKIITPEQVDTIAKSYIKPPQITNQIIEKITTPKIIKETVKIKERVEYNDKKLKENIKDLAEKIDAIKIPEPPKPIDLNKLREDLHYDLQREIDVMGMPDFRKLGMGLQQQIDELSSKPGGSGDMVSSIYDPINGKKQVAFADEITNFIIGTDVPDNETDPVFTASDAADITATDITNLGNLGSAAYADTGDFAAALGNDDNYVTDAEKSSLSSIHTQNTDTGTTGNTFTVDSDSTTGKIVVDVALNTGENHTMTITNAVMADDVTITIPATTGTLVTGGGTASGTNSGDNAANTSIVATKLDDFATPDNNTDLNANTTNHGLLLLATAPAANILNVVGIANGETAYTNKSILEQTTTPSTQAFGDAALKGTSLSAAHADHKHAMMATPTSVSGNAGTVTVAAETGDTSCSVAFVTDVSGSLPIKTNTNLTFNASTGILTATNTISGEVSGNAGTVTNGIYTTSQVTALTATAAGDKNKYLHSNSGTGALEWSSLAGGGDVLGPATNTANYIPQWDGANSKTLKDGIATTTFALATDLISSIKTTTYVTGTTQTFTADGKAIMTQVLVTGGGGGGGAADSDASSCSSGGGGGGGGTAIAWFSPAEMGVNALYSVGAAGAAGSGNGGNGGDGGDSTFNPAGTGATLTGGKGIGGTGTGSAYGAVYGIFQGGAGGAATNGTMNVGGCGGDVGIGFATACSAGGNGGASYWGQGGAGPVLRAAGATAGSAGVAYGSGGSGATNQNTTTSQNGGDGKIGQIVVIEYLKA